MRVRFALGFSAQRTEWSVRFEGEQVVRKFGLQQ